MCELSFSHGLVTPHVGMQGTPPLYKLYRPFNIRDVLNDASHWQALVLQTAISLIVLGTSCIQTHMTPRP